MDLESKMLKALEGNFFWEPTTEFRGGDIARGVRDIREAQRAFRPARVIDVIIKEPKPDITDAARYLKEQTAEHFGVDIKTIESRSPNPKTAAQKNFYMWALCRYFPTMSLTDLGKVVNRHYSTVIHGRDTFKQEEHLHPEMIAKFDALMGRVSAVVEQPPPFGCSTKS